MIPKEPKGGRATGTSFKGAFLYYTHDKREEGENVRLSSDRVDWMEFRNLATDDPHQASTIMAATAKSQDDLKRQAGASLAGHKSNKSVYHYSLGWSPDEKEGLSKAEMLRAANESIRALGAEGNQAALIAHNDTAHPHVHVIVNRVNPENGKMLDLWNSQKTLSKWALSYEQERGQVHCEKRAENWNKRAKGENVQADKDTAYYKHKELKNLNHVNDNDLSKIKAEQSRKDAELTVEGKAMHEQHTNEWNNYSRDYQDGKAKIKGIKKGEKTPFQKAAAEIKAQFKPLRSQLGRQQYHEKRDFKKRENRLAGKLENAIIAIKHARSLGRDTSKGFVATAFNFLTNSKARKDEMDKRHSTQWKHISAAESAERKIAINHIKEDQNAAMTAHRAKFANRRQTMKDDQKADKDSLSRKWRTRNTERKRSFDLVRKGDNIKKASKAKPEVSGGAERAAFNKAAKGKRKRKGRSRKQTP